jgi:alkylresorcinol/alkylpyrone synthase
MASPITPGRPMLTSEADARVRSVGRAVPEHYVDRETLLVALKEMWTRSGTPAAAAAGISRLDTMHRTIGVEGRHLALPLSSYATKRSFAERNDIWIERAIEIAELAVVDGLAQANLAPREVDHVFFVTVTGIATPSIDARLVNRLGLRSDVKRTPIFGLGCVAGAAGTARASDYLRAFPHEVALLVSVELCSLTFQAEDFSMTNVLATGLFGDGGAAIVLSGGARREPGPRVVSTRSVFYPETEDVMGWHVVNGGFKIYLSTAVPRLARERIRDDVDSFLSERGLGRDKITHWIAHTGGPKVLEAFESALELRPGALSRSWSSLRRFGNLSSASVLFVMADFLAAGVARPGDYGLLLAMGPGFCSELVLLQW